MDALTLTDKCVPYYVWFAMGFGVIAIVIGIVNFGVNVATLLVVKHIDVSLWGVAALTGIMVVFCTGVGWAFERYNIWSRITSRQNQNMNPEIKQMHSDIQAIKQMLEER